MTKLSESANRRVLSSILLGLMVSLLTFACEKDEAPPPLPSAEPAAAPSGPTVLTIDEEDAGEDVEDEKKGTGTFKAGPNLKNCCAALRQNAANAPPPNNQYMLTAAAACDAAVAAGQSRGSVTAAVQAALKGVGMPAACH